MAANDESDNFWNIVNRNEEIRNMLLKRLRDEVIPDLAGLGLNGSHGIWNFEKNDPRAIDAYDLQQCIRHDDSWHRIPEGGITRNFDKPWIRGRYPAITTQIAGDEKEYTMEIELLPEQFQIMLDAAKVYLHFTRGELRDLFSFFTENKDLLNKAKLIEAYNIPISKEIIDRYADYAAYLEKRKED